MTLPKNPFRQSLRKLLTGTYLSADKYNGWFNGQKGHNIITVPQHI